VRPPESLKMEQQTLGALARFAPPPIRLSEPDAVAFVGSVLAAYVGPRGGDLLAAWNETCAELSDEARRLTLPWPDLHPEELMAALVAIREDWTNAALFLDAVRQRLPLGAADLRWWYGHLLVWLGALADTRDPLAFLRHAILLDTLREPAEREVARRGAAHLGFRAVEVYLLGLHDDEVRLPEKLAALSRIVAAKLGPTARAQVRNADDVGATVGTTDALRSTLGATSWETLRARLGDEDPAVLLLGALRGKHDNLPAAVADDVRDRLRSDRAMKRGGGALAVEEITIRFEETPLDTDAALREFLLSRPDLTRAVSEAISADSPSGRAARSREARLREALGAAPRRRGRPPTSTRRR